MNFPKSGYLWASPSMLEILEWQSEHTHSQRMWQVSAVLKVKLEAMLFELRLDGFSRRAVFTIDRGFDDHPRGAFVRRLRNLHVDVTVPLIHAGILQIRLGHVNQLKLSPTSGLVNG
jgi:hypothetical protein